MIGILGTFLALTGLMFWAYRGLNVLFLAPIMAGVACLFHPGTPLLGTYTQIFMPALGNYLLQYFPIFILGSIFGKIMNDSGSALSIADFITRKLGPNHALLSVVLSCALLTYGGVSLFVVAFTIFPIALQLFEKANIPNRLIPGCIALGSFTFTMTALPGTPAIQNAIPMPVFGTNAFAAPGLGFIACAVMLGFGMFWLLRQARLAKSKKEGFSKQKSSDGLAVSARSMPSIVSAVAPLLAVLILNFIFSKWLFPNLDSSFLETDKFGKTSLQKVVGLWSLISALSLALILAIALHWKNLKNVFESINHGSYGSMLPIFNTASEVGFGATIAALASFEIIKNSILGTFPEYPLVSLSFAVNALAGITGSASGGLSIALNTLGEAYKQMALDSGVSLEAMHRVAAVACSGLDTLPHNGAVITLLSICGMTHRSSYIDIFMTAVVGTVLANFVIVMIGTFL
jgi:H+/gluconate symporter-like permease